MSFETDKNNPWYSMSDEELEAELEFLGLKGFFEEENQAVMRCKEEESKKTLTDLYRTLHNITPSFTSNDLRL